MLFETELDYLWYANCYIKTTANPYIITEKEYYMVQNKLMKKYGIISDSTGLIVFLLAIHFVWELSYFQSFDFLLLEDLRMFNLNFNNIIGLDSRVMRIFLTMEYMTKHLSNRTFERCFALIYLQCDCTY